MCQIVDEDLPIFDIYIAPFPDNNSRVFIYCEAWLKCMIAVTSQFKCDLSNR